MNKPDYSNLSVEEAAKSALGYGLWFATNNRVTTWGNDNLERFCVTAQVIEAITLQRQAAVVEAMAWRPIELAPLDEQELYTWSKNGGFKILIRRGPACWWSIPGGYSLSREYWPTHFQIPQPPQESQVVAVVDPELLEAEFNEASSEGGKDGLS